MVGETIRHWMSKYRFAAFATRDDLLLYIARTNSEVFFQRFYKSLMQGEPVPLELFTKLRSDQYDSHWKELLEYTRVYVVNSRGKPVLEGSLWNAVGCTLVFA